MASTNGIGNPNAIKGKTDHSTYNFKDSTRGLPVIEYVHEGKARIRALVKKKKELTPQLAEELKKPMEFNWPEVNGKIQIPPSEPSKSAKMKLDGTFNIDLMHLNRDRIREAVILLKKKKTKAAIEILEGLVG